MSMLTDLQQLHIKIDETRLHYHLSFQDEMGSDTRNRRIDAIKTNLKSAVDDIQRMIDTNIIDT